MFQLNPFKPLSVSVDTVNNYFGEKIALYFKFVLFYLSYLIPISIFGIIVYVFDFVIFFFDTSGPNGEVIRIIDTVLFWILGAVIVIWITVFYWNWY